MKNRWVKITVISLIGILVIGLLWCFSDEIERNFDCISWYYFGPGNTPRGEFIKVVLAFITAITAIIGGLFSYKRKTDEQMGLLKKQVQQNAEKSEQQIAVMLEGNMDTRFNNAVGHLDSNDATVVSSAIHALHLIALENNKYAPAVHNLFCSYIREKSTKIYKEIDFEKTPDRCPVIIQTLINYLFKPYNDKKSIYNDYNSDLSFSTLINCNFRGINIIGANFNNCDIRKCNFLSTTLNNVDFRKATLSEVIFEKAILNNVWFSYAMLNNVVFNEATLSENSFYETILRDVDFERAIFKKFDTFIRTKLDGFTPEEITSKGFSLAKTSSEKSTSD